MIIWKFNLPRDFELFNILDNFSPLSKIYKTYERISIQMPKVEQILNVKILYGEIYVWALVYQDTEKSRHDFLILGTGQEIFAKEGTYIDTLMEEILVWHIFYLGKIST